jgi:methionyl-tRNA formyltransferase
MKLIFMGTPEFAAPSLARLLEDGHNALAVFTQPDKPAGRGKHLQAPPVKLFALERGIPVHQPARIKNNEEAFAIFEALAPDACIVAAYGKILPERLLRIPRLGCINVHASLLPKYRGAAPINWAIANGERETGITIMQMDAGMDTGSMLAKRAIEIYDEETAPQLSARLALLGAESLSETLRAIERGEIAPELQDERKATYAPMLKREDGLVDWRMTAREIANRTRAFQPWPGTYTLFRGARLTFWRAREVEIKIESGESESVKGELVEPGVITSIDNSGIVVACAGSTFLRIEELQTEGKRRMIARDFVNGMRISAGERIADTLA